MDPSVNYSLMVQERGKYPAQHFHLNCFFNLQDQNMRSRYWWPGRVCVWVCGCVCVGGGGGVGSWVNVCWVCAAVLSEPLPYYSLFLFQLYTPAQSLFGKCNFRDPNLVTFYLCIYLINVVSRTECNAVSASLLLNLMKNNFLIFF